MSEGKDVIVAIGTVAVALSALFAAVEGVCTAADELFSLFEGDDSARQEAIDAKYREM